MRRGVCGVLGLLCAAARLAPAANADVLRVGTYNGIPGLYSSIQAAVTAAKPGDWILVAPGDYKTTSSSAPTDASDTPAAVLMATTRDRTGPIRHVASSLVVLAAVAVVVWTVRVGDTGARALWGGLPGG